MSNEEALKQYDAKKYRTPDGYTSDIAIVTILSIKNEEFKTPVMDLKTMLIQRGMTDSEGRPNIEAGKWALPGGFVDPNETAFECAKRELMEETSVENIHLEHFGVYDKAGGAREVGLFTMHIWPLYQNTSFHVGKQTMTPVCSAVLHQRSLKP